MRRDRLVAAAVLYAALSPTLALCQTTASEIMKAVAANQDRGQQERSRFIYEQNVKVVSRHTNGKLAREEYAEYSVTPTPQGIDKRRTLIRGCYWKNKRYNEFTSEPRPESESLDAELTGEFREDLTGDASKDGLAKDLFPLTSKEQKELKFELHGEQIIEGRPAYRIGFTPIDKSDIGWAGEALIDKQDLQPVRVYTRLSRRIPFFVRTMLGTDLPGLGFNVQYKRVEDGVWFPVSFGTEFRLRAVFFINRDLSISLENKNFRRAIVDSEIRYGEPGVSR
jgi:hypothetical protein